MVLDIVRRCERQSSPDGNDHAGRHPVGEQGHPTNRQRALLRYEDAVQFLDAAANPVVKAALAYALSTVVVSWGMEADVVPVAPFGVRFYLEGVKSMFENERVIRAIIDGNASEFEW